MNAEGRSLLLVDDDDTFRSRLARAFRERGLDVREAPNVEEAILLARSDSPEFAVLDLKMPGPSGLEGVRALHAIDETTRMVILTGYGSIATAVDAVRLGAIDYLTKPADADQILSALLRVESNAPSLEDAGPPVPSLARVEWEHIQRVLADCDGNVSMAAKLLGIHRRSLQRKLGKLPSPR